MTDIREVTGVERLHTAFTLYPYAFDETPSPDAMEDLRRVLPYHVGNHTLVVEKDGQTVATAAAFPARQNLRGNVVPMAGIAWVATHPGVRRKGLSRRLMHRLHQDMLDKGHLLATLFPSHPSFYDKLGYIGLPQNRTATFAPEGLAPLLALDLPGEVTWQGIQDAFDIYREFQRTVLSQRHGATYTPDYRAARMLDAPNRWLATATLDGEVIGTLTYRIDSYGGSIIADELVHTDPLGRVLLLRFLAQHAYQVSRITITVAPDEYPETWLSGLTVRTAAETTYPTAPPLMARLLSIEALRGAHCGPGRVEIDLVDDHLLTGRHLLDGSSGTLDITSGTAEKATLTAAGLSALAYGVLDPSDIAARGLGDIPQAAAAELRTLFPPRVPHSFGKG